MEEYYIYYLFIGDDVRYEYLSRLCGRRIESGADIKLVYGKTYSQKERGDGFVQISSPFVLPGYCYCLPKDWTGSDNVQYPKEYGMVYVFEEWPYLKKSVVSLLEEAAVPPYNSIMILYKRHINFGYTDLDKKEDPFQEAEEYYKGKCKSVFVYDGSLPEGRMQSVEYGFARRVKYNYYQIFKERYDDFMNAFQTYYGIYIECEVNEFTEENINWLRIFDYSHARKSKGTLWNFFVESYAKEIFDDNLKEKIKDLCDTFLKDIYGERHIAQILDGIFGKLKEDYNNTFLHSFMREGSFQEKRMTEKIPDNEMDYMKIMAEENTISIFRRQVSSFWEMNGKAEKICRNIIQEELKKTQKLLEKAQ